MPARICDPCLISMENNRIKGTDCKSTPAVKGTDSKSAPAERLALIREALKQNKVDYYIIPSSDPHLGEYIPTTGK